MPTLVLTSDRGSQFTSALWTSVSQSLGIQLHRTTSYHPQSNGLVERFHRTLKTSIKNCTDVLPWVLLGLRTAPKEDLRASSDELVYCEPLSVPGQFIFTDSLPCVPLDTQKHHKLPPPIPTSAHTATKSFVPDNILRARYVFVTQMHIVAHCNVHMMKLSQKVRSRSVCK